MPDDRYEPNRFMGFPVRSPQPRKDGQPQARDETEPQRVLGFPVDWFGGADQEWFDSLAHPVRGYRRWLRRRQHPPVTGESEPGPER